MNDLDRKLRLLRGRDQHPDVHQDNNMVTVTVRNGATDYCWRYINGKLVEKKR